MRQSIRALGWTITIVTLLIFAFLAISVYSLMQMLLVNQGIKLGDFRHEASNGTFVLSLTITVNNTGYFDISKLNVNTVLRDFNGATISNTTTSFGKIASGSEATERHNLTMSITDMLSKNLTYLLLQDGELKIDTSIGLRYVNVLGFQIAVSNTSIPWGAPFGNLSIGEPSMPRPITETRFLVEVPLSFENHSPFDIDGSIFIIAFNQDGALIGSENKTVSVRSYSAYSDKIQIEASLGSLQNYTGSGYLEICFETTTFRFGPVRMPYG
ncbi:MAG: hypothetical protein ACE5GD_01580 [Candidatus Geothermarchaeales archaeon]